MCRAHLLAGLSAQFFLSKPACVLQAHQVCEGAQFVIALSAKVVKITRVFHV
jgi:hypothetical protein